MTDPTKIMLFVTNAGALIATSVWLVLYVKRFRWGSTPHARARLVSGVAVWLICLGGIARRVEWAYADIAIIASFVAITAAYTWRVAQMRSGTYDPPDPPPRATLMDTPSEGSTDAHVRRHSR